MKYRGEIGLLIVAIIWGTGFVVSDIALNYMSPIKVLAFRFIFSAILIFLFFHKKLIKNNKDVILKGSILGAILYISFLFQTVGLSYTTPSKNAFITAINVVIVPIIGIVFGKKIKIRNIIAALISILGIGLLSLTENFTINPGDLLTLISAVGFAFHIYYTGEFVEKGKEVNLVFMQFVAASILALIVIIVRGDISLNIHINGYISVIYLALFSTVICFLLQTISQKYIVESKAAVILSSESLFGSIFSVILLGEIVTLRLVIGGLAIIIAIIVSEIK